MESQTSAQPVSSFGPNRLQISPVHKVMGKITSFDTGKTEFCSHQKFFSSSELLDFPDDGGFFGDIMDVSDRCAKPRSICIFRHRNNDFDVIGG